MARSRPIGSSTGALSTTPVVLLLPNGWRELKIETDVRSYGRTGNTYVAPGVSTVNGVTTLSSGGGPTGGTFTIRLYPGYKQANITTGPIAYNASAATIKTALVATGYFATGDITAAGGALPTAVTMTWTGAYAGVLPPIDIDSGLLTGGTNARINAIPTTAASLNGGYGYLLGATQEIWNADAEGNKNDRYLYLAAVTGTGTYFITSYA